MGEHSPASPATLLANILRCPERHLAADARTKAAFDPAVAHVPPGAFIDEVWVDETLNTCVPREAASAGD